ncbi:MAG: Methionine aminopeptidase [Parcubacteria group bacterium GW2011_GWF2_39_8b]|uniref:Methionine aminopeptidase n=3 Tax=Candidatus Zambryskiibacteriota TaxID=1817925 RepID=A0A1G2UQZ9_9BACT|nr:MAG: Methionine aminopeptidase [Parcubacteria group bacterium GW2011_GWF2_39_8b]KKR46221.1 MAG: Methionine aminopeptidase [Parcubacteria group bacterium GW2011_GWA2_40_14]OHA97277.1 MAG: type I methionyl aminopeptidase [Candidatus Zambryskibacteria bacterium RIFCSPHIGHO2_12_FULL_38_37]OHA97405.1 MAG: type I methionyl aminopeptidase [Candidatus Zambryskibacteria bacterium RIFCSPHIGHO2_02_FULL_39_82]OHB08102.1 MAG: type I methionyl aminopeptidase [Candidatus Zambryskibacteria bacterium RIFCSPL
MITIKKPEEIEILKEGGRRLGIVLRKVSEIVKPGISTQELEDLARKLIEDGGDTASFLNYKPRGAKRPFPAAICVSINNEIVHGIPNERPRIIQEGDIVSLDLGITHKGIITDSAVSVGVGKMAPIDQKLIDHCREALALGIKAARGGNHIGDIGYAIESFARPLGYGLSEGLAGHGVGYKVHEDPFVPNEGEIGRGELLRPGMVLALEPMLTLGTDKIVLDKDGYTYKTADGTNAAHWEHSIVITEGEPIILTK